MWLVVALCFVVTCSRSLSNHVLSSGVEILDDQTAIWIFILFERHGNLSTTRANLVKGASTDTGSLVLDRHSQPQLQQLLPVDVTEDSVRARLLRQS